MVEIEGNPKLQIACNTMVSEGMVVTNNSEKVKDAVKWGLDFHLINHPLDCPICDQAGECGLQDQYMKFGKYDPEMAEKKVNKNKVVDLGERVVLDSERCILCSRCVRFTEEISKTNELGIFDRGDRSEIGTFANKPLNNKYSVNTVDICPVGALTSKDFRFKQRVWFLKDKPSVCNGCSTGCNVDVYFNKDGVWRLKPRHNEQVNGYWMCDEGRDIYKNVNRVHTDVEGDRGEKQVKRTTSRLTQATHRLNGQSEYMQTSFAIDKIKSQLGTYKKGEVALVVTGQQTVEEYDALLGFFTKSYGPEDVYHWQNNPQNWNEFDGLLLRGDKNPNTKGLLKSLEKNGIKSQPWTQELSKYKLVLVIAPENLAAYTDIVDKSALLKNCKTVVFLTTSQVAAFAQLAGETWQIPLKSFMEKAGTFVNYNGLEQKFQAVTTIVESAVSADEFVAVLSGQTLAQVQKLYSNPIERVENQFIHQRGEM
jgi:NADH-quinone oxidoreductase subunit G